MDLIFMNASREDIGVLQDYELDLAFGADENNFECRIQSQAHCCEAGFFLYAEGTEYGGVIDSITSDTANKEVIYSGRTWQGILNSKIIEPDKGADYLTVSGDANTVLGSLVTRLALTDMFEGTSANSGIAISNYKMHRYVSGYDGARKMLESVGGKLKFTFQNGKVVLSALPIHDYSQDEEFDADLVGFKAVRNYKPINHLICLGSGELADRLVVHLYADADGNISQKQTQTGMNEVSAIYEYSNIDNAEELIAEGTEQFKSLQSADEISIDFDSDDDKYDVGDIIGAHDPITGLFASASIEKKIVTIKDGRITISLSPDKAKGGISKEVGGSGTGTGSEIYPVGSIYISTVATNPATLFGFGTWEQIEDRFLLASGSTYSAGSTGGEASHTLTIDEMPKHRHSSNAVPVNSASGGYEAMRSASYSQLGAYEGDTSYVGGGASHNNMPPYLAVYVWKRTA